MSSEHAGNGQAPTQVPASFWVVGAVSLLWNGYGVYDYVMSQFRVPSYLAQFPKAVVAALGAMPAWAMSAWAIGVWGSLAGSLLLLGRSRWAPPAFMASLAGAVIGMGWQYFNHKGMPPPVPLSLVVVAAIVGFWWYAKRAEARGWLG